MTEAGRKYISDILRAIQLIDEFTEDINDFDGYDKDIKTQSATERQLAIVGEALNKLNKVEPWLEIKNGKEIVAFRNRLIHAYDKIDNSIVWAILQKHLPQLKIEIENMENSI